MSTAHGKYLPAASIFLSIFVLVVLHSTIGSQYALLMGASFFVYLIWRVRADSLRFRSTSFALSTSTSLLKNCLILFRANSTVRIGLLMITLFFVLNSVVSGYFIISLGRVLQAYGATVMYLGTGLFILGHTGIGWILKAKILPQMLKETHSRKFFLFAFNIGLFSALLFYIWLKLENPWILIGGSFIFGAIQHVVANGVQNVGANMILSQFNTPDFATALSIANLPGYLWIGLFSAYAAQWLNGSPSFNLILIIVGIGFLIGLTISYFCIPHRS